MNSTNALDTFRRQQLEGDASHPTPSAGQPSASLADLKAAGIVFKSEEAVALVQALCLSIIKMQVLHRVLPPAPAQVLHPLGSDTVFIDATGRVGVQARNIHDVEAAIQAVAKIFSEILPFRHRQIFETRIFAKAFASPPRFGSVDEMSQILAEYGPPNRGEAIRAVYHRWLASPASKAAAANPAPNSDVFDPTALTPAAASWWRHRGVLAASAVVAAVALIGGILWLWPIRFAARVPAAEQEASLPEQQASLPEKNDISATPRPSVDGSQSRPDPPKTDSRPTVRVPSRTGQNLASPRDSRPTSGGDPNFDVSATAGGAAGAIDPAARPGNDLPAPAGAIASPREEASIAKIYSERDADVVPPAARSAQDSRIFRASVPGLDVDVMNVAVVVNADGTVDSVKGLIEPRTIGEMMTLMSALSVVKSWHFSPATKNGVPVRYRQIVPVTASPPR